MARVMSLIRGVAALLTLAADVFAAAADLIAAHDLTDEQLHAWLDRTPAA